MEIIFWIILLCVCIYFLPKVLKWSAEDKYKQKLKELEKQKSETEDFITIEGSIEIPDEVADKIEGTLTDEDINISVPEGLEVKDVHISITRD